MTATELKAIFEDLRYRNKVKNQTEFGGNIEWGRSFTSLVLNGKEKIPEGTLNKVQDAFPDFDVHAFLHDYRRSAEEAPISRLRQAKQRKEERVPFFDAPADAGDIDGDMLPISEPSGYIDTGDLFGKCEAAIRIRGNSMLKAYPSGTVLGLNRHYDSFIQPGELYVIETLSQRIFKRIYDCEGEKADCFECYSDNDDLYAAGPRQGKPYYPVFHVPKKEVLRIWSVSGSAKEHSNSVVIHATP